MLTDVPVLLETNLAAFWTMMSCPQGLLIKKKSPINKSRITAIVMPKVFRNILTNFLMGFGI
jgi:hypothetical protein